MENLDSKNLQRLPEKNAQEAKRLVGNLERHLKEIRETAEKIQLENLRNKLKRVQSDFK